MVRETRFRSWSTPITQTVTTSPTLTMSCGILTYRFASWLMCTRPESFSPMSTNAPKSTTFRTVPLSSMPGVRSSIFKMPFLKIGLGKSSRGSRSGRPRPSMMSRSVNSPASSSRESSPGSTPASLPRRSARRVLVSHHIGCKPELFEKPCHESVALGVDPGAVEGLFALMDLEEAGGLSISRRADALDLLQLLAAVEGAVLLAVFDDPAGGELVEPGDVSQQGNAGGVQVDTDKVHAARDHRFERVLELFGIDVVLVEPDTDVLRLDLDQLGERVLEPAADRDAAAQGRVEVGKLITADLAGRVDAGAGLVDDDVDELREQVVGGVGPGGLLRRWWGVLGILGPGWARSRGFGFSAAPTSRRSNGWARRSGCSGSGPSGLVRSRAVDVEPASAGGLPWW